MQRLTIMVMCLAALVAGCESGGARSRPIPDWG